MKRRHPIFIEWRLYQMGSSLSIGGYLLFYSVFSVRLDFRLCLFTKSRFIFPTAIFI